MSKINGFSPSVNSYLQARKAYQNSLDASKGIKPSQNVSNIYDIHSSSSFREDVKVNTTSSSTSSVVNVRDNISTASLTSFARQNESMTRARSSSTFSDVFEKLTKDRMRKIRKSESEINSAVAGNSSAIEVMAAVTESENALQEIVSVRDKIINAYLEIFRMSL